MNVFLHKLAEIKKYILAGATGLLTLSSWAVLPESYFPTSSIFSEGKWVKVSVTESGLYRISYDELRQMGFSNPEKVGVFGHGGNSLDENFMDRYGNMLVPDPATPVAVLHKDGNMIFYAKGVEKLSHVSQSSASGSNLNERYERKELNFYTSKGWYLLSDTSQKLMEERVCQDAPTKNITSGLTYYYHENPKTINPSGTGRYFFGEEIDKSLTQFNFPVAGIVPGTSINVKGAIFAEPDATRRSYKIYGASESDGKKLLYSSENIVPIEFNFSYPYRGEGEGKVSIMNNYIGEYYSFLEHFIATYSRSISSACTEAEAQSRYLLSTVTENDIAGFTLPDKGNAVFNITNADCPEVIYPREGNVAVISGIASPEVIVADVNSGLKSIGEYKQISKTDLRERALNGCDMIVITTPGLIDSARRFAEMHKRVDNLDVEVATVSDIYNEFSDGVPDPMAIRAFVKMTYDMGAVKPRNVLLLGPIRGEIRGITSEEELSETCIPVYVENCPVNLDRHPNTYNEFYVQVKDYLKDTFYYWSPTLGVGILPCKSNEEVDRMTKKVEKFLTNPDYAYSLNSMLAMGGTRDDQEHASDAVESTESVMKLENDGLVSRLLLVDAYPKNSAESEFYRALNTNPLIVNYFGHGDSGGMSEYFLKSHSYMKMKNTENPFIFMMGCDFTDADRNFRGIGEHFIISTDNGFVGGLVSSRKTYSAYCLTIFDRVMREAMKSNKTGSLRPKTIGEAVSAWKSSTTISEVGCMNLMCDPSLVLPLPSLKMNQNAFVKADNPSAVQVAGEIVDADGNVMTDFNGNAVVRLLEEPESVTTKNFITGESKTTTYKKEHETVALVNVDVKNGKYSATLHLTGSALGNKGDRRLVAAAYDPTSRLAAASGITLSLDNATAVNISDDDRAPMVDELSYDHNTATVKFVVSDDNCMSLYVDGFRNSAELSVDGKGIAETNYILPKVGEDGRSYSKVVPIKHLEPGSHVLSLKVRDDAGNVAYTEKIVHIGIQEGGLTLRVSSEDVMDPISIEVEGANGGEITIYIEDAIGHTVAVFPNIGDSKEWDGCDLKGNRLPDGVYTIHAKEAGGSYSYPVSVVVLSPKD